MNKFMNRKKALLYLVIASVLWSMGGLFIKLIDWNPMAIAGARSGIAAIVMIIYLKMQKSTRIHLSKIKLLGGLTYASLPILFVTANKLTTSANAILLQFTAPIWVALFSGLFLKEKIRKSDWITIIAVMLGMLLFFVGDLNGGNILGNFIAILSGISMAGVVIFLKLVDEGSPVEITLIGNVITFIIGLPFLTLCIPSKISLLSIVSILILGIFQLGISYIFYTASIKHVSSVEAILIPVLEPLLNPIWVFIFTKEAPKSCALLGGAIVITALLVKGLYQHKKFSTKSI